MRLLYVDYRLQCYVLNSLGDFLMESIVLPLDPHECGLNCERELSHLEPVVSTAKNARGLYLWSLLHSGSLHYAHFIRNVQI